MRTNKTAARAMKLAHSLKPYFSSFSEALKNAWIRVKDEKKSTYTKNKTKSFFNEKNVFCCEYYTVEVEIPFREKITSDNAKKYMGITVPCIDENDKFIGWQCIGYITDVQVHVIFTDCDHYYSYGKVFVATNDELNEYINRERARKQRLNESMNRGERLMNFLDECQLLSETY